MINGDTVKTFWGKILYFPQCIFNWKIKGLKQEIKILTAKLDESKVENHYGSPIRIFNDLLWDCLDYNSINKTLGDQIHFFDVGTGHGNYGLVFKKISTNNFGSYAGIDIYKDKNYPIEFNHFLDSAINSTKYFTKKTNFIVSSSSLEHIKEDLDTILNITKFFISNKKKFIQIHLVPSRLCLLLYLWHGWRQYSKDNLSQIYSEIYKLDQNIDVFAIPLGEKNSFKAHLINVFFPSILQRLIMRFKFLKFLKRFIRKNTNTNNIYSVKKDIRNNNNSINLFWALIIKPKDVSTGLILKEPFSN